MINWQTPAEIFVNQRESRTGRSGSCAQSGRQTFDELGFAAAEAASQCKHVTRFDLRRDLPAERFGFLRTI